jgi:molecular chaperone GrpE
MIAPRDEGSNEPRPADPAVEDEGAPRPGASSTPSPSTRPSGAPSADGAPEPNGLEEEGAAGQNGAEQVEQDLDGLLADAQKERDEYLELARRTKADFENFRRRTAAETQAAAVRGKRQLAQEGVPVLDDLERAIEAAGLDPEGDSEDGLAHGVLLVFRGLREALTRSGIEAVDPKGEKFDPNQHEALSTVAAGEGADSGVVVEVLQKGYRLDEQLIRPARVVVSE